jgi:ParB/RepB/Spo0J family partition protein
MQAIEPVIGYEPEIQELSIKKIQPNPINPRQRFNQEEEDELIESILAKGILNPIVVYKKSKGDVYVILDGERRYRACKKLNIDKIPARILLSEPNKLETLSLMFHIHNVKEEWTEFAISMTLINIIEEIGKSISHLTREDKRELTKITSLSEYKIDKYLKFQDYPHDVIQRFLKSEIDGNEEQGADPDILLEMHRPIQEIKLQMPEVLKEYSVAKIIDACIKKKAKGVIKTNKEFRLLSKALDASKKGKIRHQVVKEKIIDFIKRVEVTPESIYKSTSEAIYQVESILKTTNHLVNELNDLNISSISREEKISIADAIKKLIKLFNSRFQ